MAFFDEYNGTFKIVTMYQAGLVVLVSGQFAILAGAVSSHLDHSVARSGVFALFALMCNLTVSSLLLLAGGIAAWLNYQKEEQELEKVYVGTTMGRSTRNIFSWYESYFVLGIVLIFTIYCGGVFWAILPALG